MTSSLSRAEGQDSSRPSAETHPSSSGRPVERWEGEREEGEGATRAPSRAGGERRRAMRSSVRSASLVLDIVVVVSRGPVGLLR
ncbi:MAG: hypothetical protein J0I07_26055, partial [Myxococcales bacterium]|nr:hypothetical protein [Myxococcales bacterium]